MLDLLPSMRREGTVLDTCSTPAAIRTCAKATQWHYVQDLLSNMRRESVESDTISYNAAISACEEEFKWKYALDLLSSMRREDMELDTFSPPAAISVFEEDDTEKQKQATENVLKCLHRISSAETREAFWEARQELTQVMLKELPQTGDRKASLSAKCIRVEEYARAIRAWK